MKIWDITRPLNGETPRYDGDPPVVLDPLISPAGWRMSMVTLTTHSGTHCDAQRHFFEDGKTLDDYPLRVFIGPCRLLDVPDGTLVDAEFLSQMRIREKRVLFRFSNGRNSRLTVDGAKFLCNNNVLVVGTDRLGIEDGDENFPVHKALLGAGVIILENLLLDKIQQGSYIICILPLRLDVADGAPCRAVLVAPDDWQQFTNGDIDV